MNAQDFISSVRSVVVDASVTDAVTIVKSPPGRRPAADVVALSAWFNGLEAPDRDMVTRMLTMVARGAAFAFLAVLDGARAVAQAESPGDYFELRHVHGTNVDVLSGPNGAVLHELL